MNHILTRILFENNIIDEKIYSFQALLEDRLDFIKKQHKGQYDPLIDHIANNIDPTKNKKYTQWVLNRMLANDHIPDAQTIRSSLEWYDKASPKSHDHDINKHTMQSMMDVAHLSKTSPKANKGSNNIDKIYDKDGVSAYKVNDKQSMINLYGPGRKCSSSWCTAAAGYNNMFDRYDGSKYTIHYPNGEYMHFHHQSEQAKDPSNTEIDFSSDKRYKDYNKNTREIFEQTAEKEGQDNSLAENHFGISPEKFNIGFENFKKFRYSPDADDFKRFVGRNPLNDEQFDTALKHGTLTKKVYQNPHLTDDQVSKLLDNKSIDWTDHNLHRNPAVRGHNVDKMLNEFENNPQYRHVLYKLGAMKNLESHHVDKIIDKSAENTHYNDAIEDIIENGHKFSTEQINRLMDNQDHRHVIKLAERQTIPEHHLKTVLSDSIDNGTYYHFPHMMNMKDIMDHNNVDDNTVHKMIDDSGVDSPRLFQIMDSRNVKRNHINHIVDLYSNANYVQEKIISHEKINHDDLDKMLFNNPKKGYDMIYHDELSAYIGRKDADLNKFRKANSDGLLSESDLNNAGYYKKKNLPEDHFTDPRHARYLIRNLEHHPEFTHEQIGKLIDATNRGENNYVGSDVVQKVLDHPNVSPDTIKDLYNTWGGDSVNMYTFGRHPRTLPSIKNDIRTKYGNQFVE